MKVCSSCGIILSDSIRVTNRYSTKCKYCYNRQKRLEYKFWYKNKDTRKRFKYEIKCIMCGSIKRAQHPATKTCSELCRKKKKKYSDKIRRSK